jgi:drug/metabolite transporter (DMT)-like permease
VTPDRLNLERSATGSHRRGFWLVVAAAICWSTGGLIARLVGTGPWTTVFWRSVFCAAFLASAAVIARRGRLGRVVRDTGWPGVLIAACFATASTCFIMALARTSVANTLVIQSLSPFIAGLLGWLFLGERPRQRTWVAMGAALMGTVVMLWGSTGAGSRTGDLLALLTASAFAGATVIVRSHTGVPLPMAVALAAALGALFASVWAEPRSASGGDLALLALFGVGQLGAGLLLFTAGARLIPVAEATLIAVLESVLGPVWVWLALGERPGAFALLGAVVILSALVAHTAADLLRPPRPPGPRAE